MHGCRLHRVVALLAVVLATFAPRMVLPARAQPAGSTTASATYKGLTTTREYLPLPDTRAATATKRAAVRAEPISESLRQSYRIHRFYTKALTIEGILVMGSDKVSDWAFLEAAYTLDHMLHESPPSVHNALTKNKVRLAILAVVEYTMDLPENQTPNMQREAAYNDRRSRGLGGMPWCSCAGGESIESAGRSLWRQRAARIGGEHHDPRVFAHGGERFSGHKDETGHSGPD